MEKDIALGSLGKLEISFVEGKAQLKAAVALPGGLTLDLVLADDAGALVDLLEAAVIKAIPASQPIDQVLFPALKSLIQGLK